MPRKRNMLPPCVYLKHGAYWYVKRGKWTRLGADLHAALAEYARIVSDLSTGMVKLIAEAMVAHEKENKPAPATLKQYKTAAAKLQGIFAEFAPHQVLPRHVAEMRRGLAGTPNMANRCLTVLRIVFEYALREQLVDNNPAAAIKRLKEAKRGRYLTDAEYKAILAASSPRLSVVVRLCYLTAQRIDDVLSIRMSDLTEQGIRFKQDKGDTQLTVAWTPELRGVVDEAIALQGPVRTLTLLKNNRGRRPDYKTVYREWLTMCALAGVEDANLHDLRAKSLTDAKRQGQDATALAGHSSAAMTERYIRLREYPVVFGPSS